MIYLDHHAATPMCASARTAMAETASEAWANPASVHGAGRAARSAQERARDSVAAVLGAQAADIVFTGGGTEACNLGVLGLLAEPGEGDEVVSTELEHPAIARALEHLERRGVRVLRLAARQGVPAAPEALEALLGPGTRLLAVQWVNHETGTVWPIQAYAERAARRGVPVLVDASQALGKLPIDVGKLAISGLALTSTKIGGPAGAGALWVERCRQLAPILHGGAQERGRRPGTPNVSVLAGFGAAAREVPERLREAVRVAALRDRLEQACVQLGAVVNGAAGARVGSVTNVSFLGWRGDILVAALDMEGLCASSGAACSSGLGAPSPVLMAMYPEEPWRAESALRLSLGPTTQEHEVEQAIAILRRVLGRA